MRFGSSAEYLGTGRRDCTFPPGGYDKRRQPIEWCWRWVVTGFVPEDRHSLMSVCFYAVACKPIPHGLKNQEMVVGLDVKPDFLTTGTGD